MVKLDAFSVVGVKEFMSTANDANLQNIPKMWDAVSEETLGALQELSDLEPAGVLGVCGNAHDDGFAYWIAAATTKKCPVGFEKFDIPASEWAVFEVIGAMPDAIQSAYKQVFSEWLPKSGYEHANVPDIEWYADGDTCADDYRSELWLPVVMSNE
ncbi:MAG: GyrI-like domain-containing protein [Bifidobacteriaceae bacterium]|jgi:AraC family transcriptional regulator|nr:GyrI-like domain-containing protein [Bifidobacteriaceae bacterium]